MSIEQKTETVIIRYTEFTAKVYKDGVMVTYFRMKEPIKQFAEEIEKYIYSLLGETGVIVTEDEIKTNTEMIKNIDWAGEKM